MTRELKVCDLIIIIQIIIYFKDSTPQSPSPIPQPSSLPPPPLPQSSGKDVVDALLNSHLSLSAPSSQDKRPTKDSIANSRVSNLDLENKLLKNELQSLHEELATLSTKLKDQQQGKNQCLFPNFKKTVKT